MRIFSYALRYDDGAAPNPFWGICTLAIRKPSIRLAAEVEDWIIGLGPVDSHLGDIPDSLVLMNSTATGSCAVSKGRSCSSIAMLT